MTVSKAGQPIASLDDWYRLAPPKSRHHWVPGRSAQELARAWLGKQVPLEVAALFRAHSDFSSIEKWTAEPEARLRFDDYRGEPRNSDLVVDASDRYGPFLIAVEGKADEPCGETVQKTLAACRRRKVANPRSNGTARVEALVRWLLAHEPDEPAFESLRYQLTATAGVIRETERRGYARAVLLIHEFQTAKTTSDRLKRNTTDLNRFVNLLSRGAVAELRSGQLVGPVKAPPMHQQCRVHLCMAKASREA